MTISSAEHRHLRQLAAHHELAMCSIDETNAHSSFCHVPLSGVMGC
ncbi:MAG: hypothetical protein V7607_5877 [Solirubrobacteraceae bacterium]